ncbi:Panacea domain-containing protein [Delftia acidovorans]
MAYSAYAIANAFVQRSLEGKLSGLTPMKLQKLMYYAQAWHLRVMDRPLLDDNFARWKFGPVIPSIYHEFKDFGYREIDSRATTLSVDGGKYEMHVPKVPDHDATTWALVDAIIKRYGEMSAQTLSARTHQEGSAWAAGLADGVADGSVITHEQIKNDETI